MGVRTVIPAILNSTQSPPQQSPEPPYHPHHASEEGRLLNQPHHPHFESVPYNDGVPYRNRQREYSYGAVSSGSSTSLSRIGGSSAKESPKGKEPEYDAGADAGGGPNGGLGVDEDADGESDGYSELVYEPLLDVTWKYMSRLYLLVPVITFIFFAGLVVLVTYAWPPSKREEQAGQKYPHPLLPWPFLTGVFASFTIQSIRIPTWVVVSWLPVSPNMIILLSTILHTTLHELARLATLPMIRPSPTSGFHSSYYLGLGWGIAEAAWGIVQGWEQLSLYEDMMKPESGDIEDANGGPKQQAEDCCDVLPEVYGRYEGDVEASGLLASPVVDRGVVQRNGVRDIADIEEEELERKVEILERMRARRGECSCGTLSTGKGADQADLEDVIGLPFPKIPFPLHLLWRLDTLLLNLGLTLILSAYYFNSYPIYEHFPAATNGDVGISSRPHRPAHEPHPYLWIAWVGVTVLHLGVSLVWKVVGRVGVGAVTWGALIVSLGSVFAGLGGWGGLV